MTHLSNQSSQLSALHQNISIILKDNYLNEVTDLTAWKYNWRKIGNTSELASKICVGAGSIVAFIESYFRTGYLSLVAGSLGTVGLVARQFSQYSYAQSQSRETKLKSTLTKGYAFLCQFIKDPLTIQANQTTQQNPTELPTMTKNLNASM